MEGLGTEDPMLWGPGAKPCGRGHNVPQTLKHTAFWGILG